jgi:hypothetical protein
MQLSHAAAVSIAKKRSLWGHLRGWLAGAAFRELQILRL